MRYAQIDKWYTYSADIHINDVPTYQIPLPSSSSYYHEVSTQSLPHPTMRERSVSLYIYEQQYTLTYSIHTTRTLTAFVAMYLGSFLLYA